jgi:hypothetical protein
MSDGHCNSDKICVVEVFDISKFINKILMTHEKVPFILKNLKLVVYCQDIGNEILEAAIKKYPELIQLIDNPSPSLRRITMIHHPYNIQFMRIITDEDKLYVIQNNPMDFRYLPNPSIECIFEAVKLYPSNIKYVDKSLVTEELALLAVSGSGLTLQYVDKKFHTRDVCLAAVKSFPLAIKFIDAPEPDVQVEAYTRNQHLFDDIVNPCDKVVTLEMQRREKLSYQRCLELHMFNPRLFSHPDDL